MANRSFTGLHFSSFHVYVCVVCGHVWVYMCVQVHIDECSCASGGPSLTLEIFDSSSQFTWRQGLSIKPRA